MAKNLDGKGAKEMAESSVYRVLPCYHGVVLVSSSRQVSMLRAAGNTSVLSSPILLPGGIEKDIVPSGNDFVLPSLISLSQRDVENLSTRDPEHFSFTYYGPPPPSQDKENNQDFALSGSLESLTGDQAVFSVLADGISNGFAFSQRGAQISCFASYLAVRDFWLNRKTNDPLTDRDVGHIRDVIASRIDGCLKADRAWLLENMVEPERIDQTVWRDRFKEKPEKWYGNTLIFSFLSSSGGFIVFAGDGGIILLKGGVSGDAREIQRSSPNSDIDSYVTIGLNGNRFSGALVGFAEVDEFAEIISVTDGVDRTFAKSDCDLVSCFEAGRDVARVSSQIATLAEDFPESCDIDNYSIARIFWSPSRLPYGRLTRGAAVTRSSISGSSSPSRDKQGVPLANIEADPPAVSDLEKKKGRSMKVDIVSLGLGLALGIGVSNSIVLGIGAASSSQATGSPSAQQPTVTSQADMMKAQVAQPSVKDSENLQPATQAASSEVSQKPQVELQRETSSPDKTQSTVQVALPEVAKQTETIPQAEAIEQDGPQAAPQSVAQEITGLTESAIQETTGVPGQGKDVPLEEALNPNKPMETVSQPSAPIPEAHQTSTSVEILTNSEKEAPSIVDENQRR